MKRHPLSFWIILMIFLVSCQRENAALQLKQQTEAKILGRWQVEKKVYQEYEPITTFKRSEEYQGTAEDYYDFQPSGNLIMGNGTGTTEEVTYQVWNPTQVVIREQGWFIEDLTATRLTIYADRNDAASNKRHLTRIFFTK